MISLIRCDFTNHRAQLVVGVSMVVAVALVAIGVLALSGVIPSVSAGISFGLFCVGGTFGAMALLLLTASTLVINDKFEDDEFENNKNTFLNYIRQCNLESLSLKQLFCQQKDGQKLKMPFSDSMEKQIIITIFTADRYETELENGYIFVVKNGKDDLKYYYFNKDLEKAIPMKKKDGKTVCFSYNPKDIIEGKAAHLLFKELFFGYQPRNTLKNPVCRSPICDAH